MGHSRTKTNERHLRLTWAQQLAYIAQSVSDLRGDFGGISVAMMESIAARIGAIADELADPKFGELR